MILVQLSELLRCSKTQKVLEIFFSLVLLPIHNEFTELPHKLNQLFLVVRDILRVEHRDLVDNEAECLDAIFGTQLGLLLGFGVGG